MGGFIWYVTRSIYFLVIRSTGTMLRVGNPWPQAIMAVMCLLSMIVTFWLAMVAFPLLRYRMSPVISALEGFRSKNGTYPEDIEKLIPEYLETIPSCFPPGFSPLWYRKDKDEDDFSLTCPLVMFQKATFDSKSGWSSYD